MAQAVPGLSQRHDAVGPAAVRTLEVRCCCQPRKLMGWVDVPDDVADHGRWLVVPRIFRLLDPRVPLQIERVHFTIELYQPEGPERAYPAVKAEGRDGAELAELLEAFSFRAAP